MSKQPFINYWQVEALRLKESQWGPVEDAAELRRAIAAGGNLAQRLVHRAQGVAQRHDWLRLQLQIVRALKIGLVLLSVFFLLLGFGVALGAFASPDGQLNVVFTLLAFLALPSLSFLFWLLSFFVSAGGTHDGVGLSRLWLWLSSRLIKGPDQLLLWQALMQMLQTQRLVRWVFGSLHHWLWLCTLLSAMMTVLVFLSVKRYSFNWETTLLSPSVFVGIVQWLGLIPSWFGFTTPAVDIIRESDGLQVASAAHQVLWASWLIGCVVVYGVLPRVLALLFCLAMGWRQLKTYTLDLNQPGLIEQKTRLMPHIEAIGIDAQPPADQVPLTAQRIARPLLTAFTGVVGVELPTDIEWPPFTLPRQWVDKGIVDNREQRQTLLADLSRQPTQHLVLCVDGSQTPDRGLIAWLVELASYTEFESIYILLPDRSGFTGSSTRLPAWWDRLTQAGFKAIYTDEKQLIAELE